jgi:hypothetical protein
MPIVGDTVDCGVLSHRRDDDAIVEFDVSKSERRKKSGYHQYWLLDQVWEVEEGSGCLFIERKVTLDFYSDPDASAAMRRRLLETATVDRMLIAGHARSFSWLCACHPWGEGYRLVPWPGNRRCSKRRIL